MRAAYLSLWCWLALLCFASAETLPPKPDRYFNDYAGVVSASTGQRLDDELRQFERETSNQIVVAVYPKMDSDSSLQDYTFRIAESWKVGQQGKDNGAVLFVFTGPRTMFIQVGYGLEGALPDITCKQIIENEIKPAFKAGNFDAGLTAGAEAMMKATKGEYVGTGRVRNNGNDGDFGPLIFLGIIALVIVLQGISSWRKATVYSRNGRSFAAGFLLDFLLTVLSSGGRGGRSSGGGGSRGGFSGGGGRFGGGGAGGSW